MIYRHFLPDGTEIFDNLGFRNDQGQSFPPGWLALVPDEQLNKYGITKKEAFFVVVSNV